MALARTQREWVILVGEYNICKKKLESKREALKILTKEWQSSQRERDIYKNKINQLQQELDRYILKDRKKTEEKQQAQQEQENKQNHVQSPNLVSSSTSKDSLVQLVHEYKDGNKALRKDFFELKRLYVESQEDVQILRERMRRQSSSSSLNGDEISAATTVVEGKEEHILQLEEYKEQVASLEEELKSVKDEKSDISMERDHYNDKCERLNTQLNYILGADDRRLVDVDALVLDNKYLKEKLAQLEEERNLEKESIQKYEAAFEKKKNKLLHHGYSGARVSSYHAKCTTEHSRKTVADLRNVANILSESITEKNLALSHQRSANRILGRRVSELENKLKTLEVSGLWSLPGHRGYGSILLESANKTSNGVLDPSTATERLEWDHNSGLLELTELEKAKEKMEVNGNDLGNVSVIVNVSKNEQDSYSRDLLSRSTQECCVSENSSRDTANSGFQDEILSESRDLEELNASARQNSGIFNDGSCSKEDSTNAKPSLFRSTSAPCLAGESFDDSQ